MTMMDVSHVIASEEAIPAFMRISFDPPPVQADFAEDDVRTMNVGRRQLSTEWNKIFYEPGKPDDCWRMVLPFPNTYENAFESMCECDAYPHHAKGGKLCIFLRGTEGDAAPPEEATRWAELVGKPVAMKDFLAISFALDYERHGGNPEQKQTQVGTLRSQAKPYGGSAVTAATKAAANELIQRCVDFINSMSCYASADCVVAMPPSDPTKAFNLPRYLAKGIAKGLELHDLSEHVNTVKARNSIKAVPLAQKLDTLLRTIEVDDEAFADRKVLLIDDLYQSGVSMNYCGLLLLQAGAKKILGLACEKTCRNDDNVAGRQ